MKSVFYLITWILNAPWSVRDSRNHCCSAWDKNRYRWKFFQFDSGVQVTFRYTYWYWSEPLVSFHFNCKFKERKKSNHQHKKNFWNTILLFHYWKRKLFQKSFKCSMYSLISWRNLCKCFRVIMNRKSVYFTEFTYVRLFYDVVYSTYH